RRAATREGQPVEFGAMPGYESHTVGRAAVGDRNAKHCRHADAGGDAGNDLDLDAGGLEHGELFCAAAEDEGISALQARDDVVLCIEDQQLLDERLRGGFSAAAFVPLDDPVVVAGMREPASA